MIAQDSQIMAQIIRRMLRWSDDGLSDQMMSHMVTQYLRRSDDGLDGQMKVQMFR